MDLEQQFPNINLIDKTQNNWYGWADEKALNELKFQPKKIWYRFDNGENRFYWSNGGVDENHPNYPLPQIDIAMGITSALSLAFPESFGIQKWKDSNPNWKTDLQNASEYGTLYHIACEQYMKEKKVDKEIFLYAEKKWRKGTQMKRDMAAFAKFVKDYNVRPILIEFILSSDPYTHHSVGGDIKKGTSICSAIDNFCFLDFPEKYKEEVGTGEFYQKGEKKGQEKTKMVTKVKYTPVLALVDMKSNFFGKEDKSFYESHKMQLIFGKNIVCKNFGIDPDSVRIFNFSPLAWRSEPNYTLKEHKSSPNKVGFNTEYVLMTKLRGAFVNGDLEPSGVVYDFPDEFTEADYDQFMALDYEEFILKEYHGATQDQIKAIRAKKYKLVEDAPVEESEEKEEE